MIPLVESLEEAETHFKNNPIPCLCRDMESMLEEACSTIEQAREFYNNTGE